MAITVYTNNQYYSDIADAIRNQNGTNNTYTPAEMAEAIISLSSTGGSIIQDADGYLILDDKSSSNSSISLIDTIVVSENTRSVNIDLTQYSEYDILIITEDLELTESDWLYYSPNATTPTGGSYNSGSKVKHQGVAIWRFVLGGNGGLVKGYVSSGGYTQVNTAGTLDNILIYTYVATKYIKAGSTFKVYGGKYADL